MRIDRFLWACVILAILLLCGYELAHCQIVPASEMRLTAGTPYTVPGRYQIMINSATGRITCTTPTGTDCSPTAGSIAWGAITGVPATFAPSAHTHSAADINAGILSPLYGGTGWNGAPADIILVGNGTTYDQRSLCTGYVKYSLTTHLLTCDAGTGGSFTGGTLSTKLTLAPSTLTGAGLNLGTGSVTPTSGLATGDLWGDAAWELNWWDGANQRTAERRDHKGQPNGYAPLDSGGLVPVGNLPAGSTGVNVTGNAQQYAGFCTGTASSSTTLSIPPFGTANASSCSSTTTTNELPMSWSGTLRNLQVKAGSAGRLSTSGVVTLYKNGVATGITCTIGTGTICSDVTHTSTVNVGDTVGIRMTTQSTETLANVRVTFEDYGGGTGFNYRGAWTASTIYNPYDIVSYNGTTYERSGPTFTSAGTFNAANWNVWAAGATGGIPIGGTTGQVLAKNSAIDYDVGWVTGGGGGGSGTVTSVALTAPAQFTVTGSPVTTAGTLGLTWATQAANIVFAGPTSGGVATPGFRALVAADIPTLNQSTTGNAATATALAADGTDCSAGNYARGIDASGNATGCTVAGGGGTVTSFSAGNLSPLFTTSVATATTTPALTFTLSNATAHTFYGNNTGSTGAPAFVAITAADVPILNQNTTGTAAALAANGTNCTANQFNKGVDASGNAESCAALVSGDIPNNAANTTGTSANVTGTVAIGNGGTGQTAKTAAFNALSPLTTLGDIPYHDGTNSVRLAGNTVATRKFLRQLGTGAVSAAPAWDTILAADIPTLNQSTTGTAANVTGIVAEANGGTGAANTTGAAGHYLRSNATHYVDSAIQAGDVPTLNQSTTGNAGTATALAANGTNCGAGSVSAGVDASGNAEGCTATVAPTAHNLLSTAHGDTTAATVSRGAIITGQTATPKWQLLAAGSASQCLQMDASGVDIIWGACATGGSGSPGGATTQVQFNDAGSFGGDADFTWDKANNILTVGPAASFYQTIASVTQTANRAITFPDMVGPGVPNMDASGNVTYVNQNTLTAVPSSLLNTTASCTSGSAAVTLGAAQDFVNTQGIALTGCGAVTTATTPTAPSAAFTGTAGATTYTYQLIAFDALQGIAAPTSTFTCTSANAALSNTNYCTISFTGDVTNNIGYAVYGRVGGSLAFIGYPYCANTVCLFYDTGGVHFTRTPWIPNTPPAGALRQTLFSSILSGGGTTSITVANNAGATFSGFAYHDDSDALNTLITNACTTGTSLYLPIGNYWVSKVENSAPDSGRSLLFYDNCSNVHIYGAGPATVINTLSKSVSIFEFRGGGRQEIDHLKGVMYAGGHTDRGSATGGSFVRSSATVNAKIHDLDISGGDSLPIWVTGGTLYPQIYNNLIYNASFAAINEDNCNASSGLAGGCGTSTPPRGTAIYANTAFNIGDQALPSSVQQGSVYSTDSGGADVYTRIQNNHCEYDPAAWVQSGNENCFTIGNSGHVDLIGNTSLWADGRGIEQKEQGSSTVRHTVIADNTIDAPFYQGIHIWSPGGSGGVMDGTIIVNNTISRTGFEGIYLDADATSIINANITNNQLKQIGLICATSCYAGIQIISGKNINVSNNVLDASDGKMKTAMYIAATSSNIGGTGNMLSGFNSPTQYYIADPGNVTSIAYATPSDAQPVFQNGIELGPTLSGRSVFTMPTTMKPPLNAPAIACSNTGGSLAAATHFIKYVWNNGAANYSTGSLEASCATTGAVGSVTVTAPGTLPAPANATGWTVYDSNSTGTELQQAGSPACVNIALTSNCVITTLAAGGALSATATASAGPASCTPAGGDWCTVSGSGKVADNMLLYHNGSAVQLGVSQTYRVTADFTTAANTNLQTITGLSWVLPPTTVLSVPFQCQLAYHINTAAAAVSFGIQAATIAPTNIFATADMFTAATTDTEGVLATLATTTATAVVTATPSAITTDWRIAMQGMIENPSNASSNTINIMVKTATAADAVVVKRGSFCKLF